MPKTERVYAALGNEVRVAILRQLTIHGPSCACEIIQWLRLGKTTVSYHVSRLRAAGLVNEKKIGRWRVLQINWDTLERYAPPLAEELRALPKANVPPLSERIGRCGAMDSIGARAACQEKVRNDGRHE